MELPCNTISVFSNLVFKEVEKQSGKSRFSVYKINYRVIIKTVSLECPQLGFFSIEKTHKNGQEVLQWSFIGDFFQQFSNVFLY